MDPKARELLKRKIRVTVGILLETDLDTWSGTTSLPEYVFLQLEILVKMEEHALYLALFQRFLALLEVTGPFKRLDILLVYILDNVSLTPSDFINFADTRVRWLIQSGDMTETVALLERAWQVADTLELRGQVANRQGIYWKNLKEYEQSLKYFEMALTSARSLGDIPTQASLYNNLGNWAFAQDLYTQALEYYKQAWETASPIPNARILGAAAGGIAMTLEALQEYQDAFIYMDMAEVQYQNAGYRPGLLRILLNRGYLAGQTGRIELALKSCNEALLLARELGDVLRESTGLHNLGVAYTKMQDWESALSFFEQALTRRRTLDTTLFIETTLEEITAIRDTLLADTFLSQSTRIKLLQRCAEVLNQTQ